jgi:hypothetical protein
MAELIHSHSARLVSPAGTTYRAEVHGEERADGTWSAWLEFIPLDGGGALRTSQESSQPNRKAVEYWAGGLEALYLEGAFDRALRTDQTQAPGVPPPPDAHL